MAAFLEFDSQIYCHVTVVLLYKVVPFCLLDSKSFQADKQAYAFFKGKKKRNKVGEQRKAEEPFCQNKGILFSCFLLHLTVDLKYTQKILFAHVI